MDEPLSNLDAQLRVEMRREIRALQRRLGMTMLYVTHDQVEAMTMADQVVLMRNGRIEQDARARRAVRAARDDLRGALRRHAADERHAGDAAGRQPGRGRARPPAMRRISSRSASGPRPRGSARTACRRRVAAVEYLGADTLIETRLGGSVLHRAAGRPRDARRVGETVHIRWEPAAAHWFDLSSQCRIDR